MTDNFDPAQQMTTATELNETKSDETRPAALNCDLPPAGMAHKTPTLVFLLCHLQHPT